MENKGIIRIEESDTKKIIKLLEEIKEENEKRKTISITTQTAEGIQTVIEKRMQEKKNTKEIGDKVEIIGNGRSGSRIILDGEYEINNISKVETKMTPANGMSVIVEFSPEEIITKINKKGTNI